MVHFDQGYESSPICMKGTPGVTAGQMFRGLPAVYRNGADTYGAGWDARHAAGDKLVVEVKGRPVANDGKNGPRFTLLGHGGAKEPVTIKVDTVAGIIPSAADLSATVGANIGLAKEKVLGVLVAINELVETVSAATDFEAVFERVKKDVVVLTTSLNKLQVDLVKMEREEQREGLRGAGKALQPTVAKVWRQNHGPVTTPMDGPGAGFIPDYTTKLPRLCTRFHASPQRACTAGVMAGHPSGKVGWCLFAH